MGSTLHSHEFQVEDQTTHYWDGGPEDGPLLFFIHGWPDVGLTWKHQLKVFAGLGFRVIAPDMRGYGKSSAPQERRAYRLEQLVQEQLALLEHIRRDKAIWVGHDWGCAVLSALAAHYPEKLNGAVWLSVPYRVQEMGLDELLTIVNRDIYPEAEFPFGQWSYMKFYEQNTDAAVEQLRPVTDTFLKMIYKKSDPESWGRPAPTSRTAEDGNLFGWFGGSPELMPDIPLEATSLDDELYTLLRDDKKQHGWFPATAYYLNSDVNAKYDESKKNNAILDVPCLYIDSKYDPICSSTTSPKFRIPMTKACRNLTEAYIGAAHWTHLEKPREVNAVLAKWLKEQLPQLWPFNETIPLQKA